MASQKPSQYGAQQVFENLLFLFFGFFFCLFGFVLFFFFCFVFIYLFKEKVWTPDVCCCQVTRRGAACGVWTLPSVLWTWGRRPRKPSHAGCWQRSMPPVLCRPRLLFVTACSGWQYVLVLCLRFVCVVVSSHESAFLPMACWFVLLECWSSGRKSGLC